MLRRSRIGLIAALMATVLLAGGMEASARAAPAVAKPAPTAGVRMGTDGQDAPLRPISARTAEALRERGPSPRAAVAAGPVDALQALIDIITYLVQIFDNHKAKDQGAFVQGVINDSCAMVQGHYNVLMVKEENASYDTNFNGVRWEGRLHYSWDGSATYHYWIFESGSFRLRSDGGWRNWGFCGRFTGNGPEVVFHQADGNSLKKQDQQSKCVDVQSSSTNRGTPIQMYDCNATNAQWWYRDGLALRSGLPGNKCLDAGGGGWTDKVQLWDCNGSPPQQWDYVGNGSLRNRKWNYCLDIPNGDTGNGNRLQMMPCNDGPAQRFTLP
ncbi:ricin-type beta-trefoil lectin domain protein [Streptomyces sp. BHT-5-2]|uniref:ricin-type beta-trefoil lectin domain protein n=1 Tax=Streptomyces sp. BHT-5-2 TaxID=2866715 RepID=UPI001C8DC01A|nr:ricin-type beta-trefoil lectin domain protein [Streptomyces sp. BHT-5-2]QZL04637.1 ricin-type beta-trefoil lectin domain protein [Streptomyces sp. BHT-5-2]